MTRWHSFVGTCLVTVAAAQTARVIAYPQDTTSYSTDGAVMRGTAVPLGGFFLHGGHFQEGRWQQIVPREHLPTVPGRIVALSAVCADLGFNSPPEYRRLRITLSATGARSLSFTFAANLPAPVTVLDRTNLTVGWTSQSWGRIDFAIPFAYDGRSNLVVEFRKEATSTSWGSHAMPVNPERGDLPRAVSARGAVGSGAADATVASASDPPLQLRLHVETDATLTLRSDRLPAGSRHVFALRGTFDLAVHAPPAAVHVTIVDTAFHAPYGIPSVRGAGLVLPSFQLPPRIVPASGVDTQTFAIPAATHLVGQRLALQALVAAGPSPLFSNGADLVVSTN